MSSKSGPELELPPEVRAIAEKNVAQARQAFETLFDGARKAVGDTEGSIEDVRTGFKELRQKTLGLVEANVAATFEFLNKLVSAKNPQEVLSLQAEFLSSQMQVAAEQARTLGSEAKAFGESAVRNLDQHNRALAERVKELTATAAQNAQAAALDMKSLGEAAFKGAKAAAEQAMDPNAKS